MKIGFVIFLIGIIPFRMISQSLTPAERQQIIAKLDSSDKNVRFEALDNIYKYKISEALPKIEQNFWKEDVPHQRFSFMALEAFHSANLHTLARAFYDSAEILARKEPFIILDPLELKVTATYYLHKTGDYSTTPCIFEFLRRGNKTRNPFAQKTLKSVIKNVPEYADSAKVELIRVTREPNFMASRIKAMYDLVELYGQEMYPEIVNMIIDSGDSGGGSRLMALELLYKMNYPGLHDLLKDRLSKEVAPAYRGEIADSLLLHYGGIDDYLLVKNYIDQEVNPTIKSLLGFSIRDFIPVRPNAILNVLQLIDLLESTSLQVKSYNWFGDQSFEIELKSCLSSAKGKLTINDSLNCARQIRIFQQRINEEYIDSLDNDGKFVTIEGWKFLCYNAQYILDRLPKIPPTGCNIKLVNSIGIKLTGGTLQYYEGSWKDAVNNNDGTFFVNTTKTTLSLRMTYDYGTQTKSNVTVGYDTVAFQTVNAQIQLQNSNGVHIDTGSVQYYAGAWRTLGTTTNGVAAKELLPANYSFRMTYAYASKDKQQDISTNATVVFQTVNAAVQLQNSQGSLMDQGTVRYYSGTWRDLGTTTNGVANKELLPNNYSFRMTYAYASKDKQQDIGANAIVIFQTVNAAVQLQNSQGTLMDQGAVQYYSGAWRNLGTTTNGTASKELLQNNYSFRMTYEYVSLDKAQDISTNNTVSFSTVLCTIRVKNSQNQPVNNALVSYYSGAWRQIGNTVNGEITKELLPVNLSFRVKYGTQQQDKQQNLSTNNVVEFAVQ
jgi:hypothetical protein